MKDNREKVIWLRRKKKIERQKRRRNKKHKRRRYKISETNSIQKNIVGSDYLKVLKFFSRHKILSRWKNNSKYLVRGRVKNEKIIQIPAVFSVTEDPESVLEVLYAVLLIKKDRNITELTFDYSKCIRMGLSASTILDILVMAVSYYRTTIKCPIYCKGNSPQNVEAKEILYASGLPHHLNARVEEIIEESPKELFNTVKGRYSLEINMADKIATDLTLYFDRCLKTQEFILNNNGHYLLSTLLGEVITNCEIHGGKESTWYIQGHYQINHMNSYGEMQLLFLNIGNTIYEGLKESASDEMKQKLEYASEKCKRKGNKDFDEESLYTVFALQEGISRLRNQQIKGYAERGSGTVSMIEFFVDLGESDSGLKPQMSILSGSTQIIFDDTYKLHEKYFNNDIVFGTGERKIIAFNALNDIYQHPDKNNVKKIKGYFPGTVISLQFYLDGRYIEKRKEGKN